MFKGSDIKEGLDLIEEVQMSGLSVGDLVKISGFDKKTEGLIGTIAKVRETGYTIDFGAGFDGHDGDISGATETHWFVSTEFEHKVREDKKMENDGFYLVWNPARGIPTFKHWTYEDATTEAERLANKHPGEHFYVLKTIEMVQTQNVVRKEKVEPEK
jgi:hypothetical protein